MHVLMYPLPSSPRMYLLAYVLVCINLLHMYVLNGFPEVMCILFRSVHLSIHLSIYLSIYRYIYF
jgi:hypothetical protein